MEVLNRVILSLSASDREDLRQLPAMQQEIYLAKRDCVGFLQKHCFNALNAIDLRANEALSVRVMQRRCNASPIGSHTTRAASAS